MLAKPQIWCHFGPSKTTFENPVFCIHQKKCPEGLLMHPLAQPSRAPTTTAERDWTLKTLRETSGCCCAYSWWAPFFPTSWCGSEKTCWKKQVNKTQITVTKASPRVYLCHSCFLSFLQMQAKLFSDLSSSLLKLRYRFSQNKNTYMCFKLSQCQQTQNHFNTDVYA